MDSHSTPTNTTKSPVLFLVFNRPDMTAEVFEAIRKAKPERLYVAGDGPRHGVHSDLRLVEETRRIATQVDWPCHVETLFRESNLGCKAAVGEAISWFFLKEHEGIILEDDTVPHPDFFLLCDSLLEKYRNETRVSAITGGNFQNGEVRGDASYYFSRHPHVWGWATWRRAWLFYDPLIEFWPRLRKSKLFKNLFSSRREMRYWTNIMESVHKGRQTTSWGYPWMASVFSRNGLVATPNVNLVSNIGWGSNSTHTKDESSPFSRMRVEPIGIIKHPSEIVRDSYADRNTFSQRFDFGLLQNPFDYAVALRDRLSVLVTQVSNNSRKH